jgi:hypothetical protein
MAKAAHFVDQEPQTIDIFNDYPLEVKKIW